MSATPDQSRALALAVAELPPDLVEQVHSAVPWAELPPEVTDLAEKAFTEAWGRPVDHGTA